MATLSGYCAWAYACGHPKGKGPELSVVVEKMLGVPARLCAKCAAVQPGADVKTDAVKR